MVLPLLPTHAPTSAFLRVSTVKRLTGLASEPFRFGSTSENQEGLGGRAANKLRCVSWEGEQQRCP